MNPKGTTRQKIAAMLHRRADAKGMTLFVVEDVTEIALTVIEEMCFDGSRERVRDEIFGPGWRDQCQGAGFNEEGM